MFKLPKKLAVLGFGLAAVLISSTAPATTKYVDNLEGMSLGDIAALSSAGWVAYVNLFQISNPTIKVGEYNAGGAPNDPAYDGISRLVCGQGEGCEGGEPQGDVVLSVFSNYPGQELTSDPDTDHDFYLVETNAYKEVASVDAVAATAGETWRFSFDAKKSGDPLVVYGGTTMLAFVKVLCNVVGPGCAAADFSELAVQSTNMTSIGSEWNRYTVDLILTSDMSGKLLQFGFANTATDNEGSVVYYDNLCFAKFDGNYDLECATQTAGGITPWSDDFEGYDNTDSTTLEPNYNVFGNVDLDSTGPGVDYGYGAVAPNNWDPGVGGTTGDGFSALAPNQGANGDVALSVFSDYDNADAHANGLGTVESNFLKEYTVAAGNVGETWTYAFDAKLGALVSPTTASAFIKVLCSQDIPACGGGQQLILTFPYSIAIRLT